MNTEFPKGIKTKPGLGFRELGTAKIPLPPIALQRAFAAHVENLAALRRQRRKALQQLQVLWQTVLTSAFSGNLTRAWREAHSKELLEEMEQQTTAFREIH